MKRRKLLSVVGTLTAGGTLATASGAFSNVQAQRDLAVKVAGDANAYLRIAPTDGPNGAYATGTDDGTLLLDLTGNNENVSGKGVNRNAITYFDEVFIIQNQGTQQIDLTVSPLSFIEIEPGVVLLVLLIPLDSPAFGGGFGIGAQSDEADITSGLTQAVINAGKTIRFSVLAASFEANGQASVGFSDDIEISAEASQQS
jgi:hypothetical protein